MHLILGLDSECHALPSFVACCEQNIAVTTSVGYMCVVCASGFVQPITCTFMHGFQNWHHLAQWFSLGSKNAI